MSHKIICFVRRLSPSRVSADYGFGRHTSGSPSPGKPVLVLRDKTEGPEAVGAGTAILVGADFEKTLPDFLMNPTEYAHGKRSWPRKRTDRCGKLAVLELLKDALTNG